MKEMRDAFEAYLKELITTYSISNKDEMMQAFRDYNAKAGNKIQELSVLYKVNAVSAKVDLSDLLIRYHGKLVVPHLYMLP